MTIRIVIDNEDAAEVKAEGSKLFWTANVYLNDKLISVESGLGTTPAEALANMRPDIDFTEED